MNIKPMRFNLSGRLALAGAVMACTGLLMAASCQEQKTTAAPAAGGKAVTVEDHKPGKVFEPQVAGSFYPADAKSLRAMIDEFLGKAQKGKTIDGDILGVIVPHAGYPYSGPVAAFAFQAVRGRDYKRVVVLGPAHHRWYPTPALLDADAYRTPLGDVPIDRRAVKELAATGIARLDEEKFIGEHALEVELPFLQVVVPGFKLVPLMISQSDPQPMKKLAAALKKTFPGNDTLFVASTDMSHDFSYDVAQAMDKNALRYVTVLDTAGLFAAYQAFRGAHMNVKLSPDERPQPDCAQFCGMGPVLTLMELARLYGDAKATVLDRRNSGDVVGDKNSRIVGYSAVAVSLAQARKPPAKPGGSTGDYLNDREKQALLKIAREALDAYVRDGKTKDFEPKLEGLIKPGAAFVTLKKQGQLRGCIGYMEPVDPLWKMVRDRAIDAAVHDTRFRPVVLAELADIEIEISVLTPRVPVKDPLAEIEIGRDGVWLQLGFNRGVFLPQVPVEQHWDTVEEYLDNLCRKAHVFEKGCWKSPKAQISRFSALVFGESK
ncbi:MAG TPA: AmmeMemoRadiSam system protein B [Myxococcota bacterium]|nr:AmmeMemoRadiSam system protein B [Myxococcota bacterium]